MRFCYKLFRTHVLVLRLQRKPKERMFHAQFALFSRCFFSISLISYDFLRVWFTYLLPCHGVKYSYIKKMLIDMIPRIPLPKRRVSSHIFAAFNQPFCSDIPKLVMPEWYKSSFFAAQCMLGAKGNIAFAICRESFQLLSVPHCCFVRM